MSCDVAVRRHRWARALLIHAASHVNLTMKKKSCMSSYFCAYMWLCFHNYGSSLGGLQNAGAPL